ncbi:terminase large subunit domain-containing protein [Tenacibaculum sp. nBUS_03]|uniref:terminase large subunit domain-containing protein n=1 Tax=Tenacibaculum sp. nBUS_03 TaxID=3395320 RepID=UPI003EBD9437
MMKNNNNFREIQLNPAQMAAFFAVEELKKSKVYLEWGRGTGKSFILAYFMKKMVKQMPGASFALVGSTYQQILARTLPSTKKGLAKLGIFENVDYVVGKNGTQSNGFKPPEEAPNSWKNIIHFSNGAIFHLVSLDNSDSGRGFNVFGVLGDEAALFDPEKLYYNVKATNRAKSERFPNASLLGCEIYASSTPLSKKGKWFTDMEEKIIKKQIKFHEKYIFIKAPATVNKINRPEWYIEMEEQAPSKIIYNAEILNIRPKEILNGFYPQFGKKHLYTNLNKKYLMDLTPNYQSSHLDCRKDADLDTSKPLTLSIDWGIFISLVVSQTHANEHRVVNSFHKQQPEIINNLIDDFCDYYEEYPNKRIQLYYGHDGNARTSNSMDTYGDQVVKMLKQRGWRVTDKSKGKPAAPHNLKYTLINLMFKGYMNFPKITINEVNNPNLIISIERAEATDGRNGIEKVKKDEKNQSMKQEHTTHYSDAFDIPIWELYKDLLSDRDREHIEFLTA